MKRLVVRKVLGCVFLYMNRVGEELWEGGNVVGLEWMVVCVVVNVCFN